MAELIDVYKDAKRAYERIKICPEMLFEPDDTRDKSFLFGFSAMIPCGGGFQHMAFDAPCHWGEYGRSGSPDYATAEIGRFLAMAINNNIEQIYADAVEYARIEMEAARLNAATEARAILDEVLSV